MCPSNVHNVNMRLLNLINCNEKAQEFWKFTEREVLAVQIDGEIRLVVLVEDEWSRRLPGERRSRTHPDRLPEPLQVYVSLTGAWSRSRTKEWLRGSSLVSEIFREMLCSEVEQIYVRLKRPAI